MAEKLYNLAPTAVTLKKKLLPAVKRIKELNGDYVLGVRESLIMHGFTRTVWDFAQTSVDKINVDVETLSKYAGIPLEDFRRDRIAGRSGDAIGGYTAEGGTVWHRHAAFFDDREILDDLNVLTIPACLRELKRIAEEMVGSPNDHAAITLFHDTVEALAIEGKAS